MVEIIKQSHDWIEVRIQENCIQVSLKNDLIFGSKKGWKKEIKSIQKMTDQEFVKNYA